MSAVESNPIAATGERRWPSRNFLSVTLLAATTSIVFLAFVRGRALERVNPDVKLGAAPLVGQWHWRLRPALLAAVFVVVLAVWLLPRAAARARLRWIVLGAALTGGVFPFALAASDGWSAVIAPVVHPTEYWAGVRTAQPFTEYLDIYIERALYHSVHVRGHPPGMSLLLIAMRPLGLRSPWAAAALSFLGAAATVVAVCIAVWRLVGASAARRAAPVVALAPFAVWQGTSADAVFCGVAAWGIALAAIAATTNGRRCTAAALGGGLLTAAALFLTYGAAMLFPVYLGILAVTRRIRWLLPFGVAAGLVVAAFLWGGFWWLEGLRDTQGHYWRGTAQFRPPGYFAYANLAALAIAVGAPVVWSFTRVRARGNVLPLAALVSVGLANASQYSKGETERIWLIFMPWIALAGIAVASTLRRQRAWMTAQGIGALVLQAALVSKW